MSIRLMSLVWDRAPLGGSELLMLLAIADHANDDGVCWPSVPHLANKCRVSERHAKRLVRSLEDRGLVAVIERGGADGRRSSRYLVRLDALGAAPRVIHSASTGVTPVSPPGGVGVTPGGDVGVTRNHQEPPEEPSSPRLWETDPAGAA